MGELKGNKQIQFVVISIFDSINKIEEISVPGTYMFVAIERQRCLLCSILYRYD